MCTVVIDRRAGGRPRILALRDELTTRAFDEPGRWWPHQPSVVGGRDAVAGGSWCVSDVDTGITALVLNRIERRTGSPSRGLLPLAAVSAGERWVDTVDHRSMAAFTLLLAMPSELIAWTWDARELRREVLGDGLHLATPSGVDTTDTKTTSFAPHFATSDWRSVIAANPPADREGALVVRHPVDTGVWATVFGQLIDAAPGHLTIDHSRTPWQPDTWTSHSWTSATATARGAGT